MVDTKIIVPIRNAGLSCRAEATHRKGEAMSAAARPTPWLTLLAISSPRDWVHFGAANNSSITFISQCCLIIRWSGREKRKARGCADPQTNPAMFKTIFFDAAGTLIYLPKSVGYHYALVAERVGLPLES